MSSEILNIISPRTRIFVVEHAETKIFFVIHLPRVRKFNAIKINNVEIIPEANAQKEIIPEANAQKEIISEANAQKEIIPEANVQKEIIFAVVHAGTKIFFCYTPFQGQEIQCNQNK